MKQLITLALLLGAQSSFAQTTTPIVLTSAEVLGCSNPAPAAVGGSTVWMTSAGCKIPAFVPTTSTSVIASGSKTTPTWPHTFSGYAATDLIVACPIGATVSGSSCTYNGVDVSALVAQSAVQVFTVTPPAPPPPVLVNATVSLPGSPNVTYTQIAAGSCFSLTDGTHTVQACLPTN